MSDPERQRFEEAARQQRECSLVVEFIRFLAQNKAWWLVPILLCLVLFGALLLLSGSAAAPFIYPLF